MGVRNGFSSDCFTPIKLLAEFSSNTALHPSHTHSFLVKYLVMSAPSLYSQWSAPPQSSYYSYHHDPIHANMKRHVCWNAFNADISAEINIFLMALESSDVVFKHLRAHILWSIRVSITHVAPSEHDASTRCNTDKTVRSNRVKKTDRKMHVMPVFSISRSDINAVCPKCCSKSAERTRRVAGGHMRLHLV